MPGPRETMVTITVKEHARLKRAQELLCALEAGGVDNWEGYYEATREFYGDNEEDEE